MHTLHLYVVLPRPRPPSPRCPGPLHGLLPALSVLKTQCSLVLVKPKSHQVLCSQLDCGCPFTPSISHYLPVTRAPGAPCCPLNLPPPQRFRPRGLWNQGLESSPPDVRSAGFFNPFKLLIQTMPLTHASPTTLFKIPPPTRIPFPALHTNTLSFAYLVSHLYLSTKRSCTGTWFSFVYCRAPAHRGH